MSNEQLEQVEALQQASPFFDRMIVALDKLIAEYDGNKQADTEEYMHSILQGLEWIFAVYRGTKSLVNPDGTAINQSEVNDCVYRLNAANKAQDDAGRVEAFKGIKKFVSDFKHEASCVVAAA